MESNIEEKVAARRRSVNNRELLIAAGEDNVEKIKELLFPAGEDNIEKVRELLIAAGENNVEKVRELLIAAGEVNVGKVRELFIAAGEVNVEKVRELLIATGEDNVEKVRELLIAACEVNVEKVRELLIAAGEDNVEKVTELLIAAGENNVEKIRELLIAAGEDNITKVRELPIAAGENNIEKVVELLIAAGEDNVEKVGELLIAAREDNVEKVACLLKHVDVDFTDGDGDTALHYAAIKGSDEVVNYLLENGADIYIENNDDKTPFHIAVSLKNEKIIRIFGRKIISKSQELINQCKYELSTIRDTEPNTSSNKKSELEKVITKTRNKIEALSNHLEALKVNNNELSYKQANIFILFLETFSFESDCGSFKNDLVKQFMEWEGNKIISDTRNLILKSPSKDIELSHIRHVIESCYVTDKGTETEFKVKSFFDKLKEYVKHKAQITEKTQNEGNKIKVSSFFQKFPDGERNELGIKSGTTDQSFNKLKKLVLEAYKKERNLEKQWFEFVVNIYPSLRIERKEKISVMEKQIKHLRNNLIHEFYQFGIQEFGSAIIKLRGKLFEYYYAKEVQKRFERLNRGMEIKIFKNNLNEDFEKLQAEFQDSEEILSGEEADNSFGYKLVKLLYPKPSLNIDNSAIKRLVEDCFKFMPIIEDVNRADHNDDRTEKKYVHHKKILDVTRRELFEKFIRLRRIKDNCADGVYRENREEFLSDLGQYGVEKTKSSLLCKHYLGEGKSFNDEVSEIIENVVRLIRFINLIIKNFKYEGKEIVPLCNYILNKDSFDKKLILSEKKMKWQEYLLIMSQSCVVESWSNTNVRIPIANVFLEIDIKQTVMNILRILFNVYNEYKIEFKIENIFSSESFLEELVCLDEKKRNYETSLRIIMLIDVEHMSPYIVKLIKNTEGGQASQVINKNDIEKLIDNLLNEEEYVIYLNILLSVEIQNLNLYEKLYDKILERKVDIKNIRSIFKEFKHLVEFADLIRPTDANNEQQKYILELTKSFLRITNEEAADRLSTDNCSVNYDDALKILKKGEEIQNRFQGVIEDSYPDFIDRDLLIVQIKNSCQKYEEASNILIEVKKKLESSISISHKAKFLLTLSIICYTNKLSNKCSKDSYDYLYSEIIKYILDIDDVSKRFDVAHTVKEKYNQIKSLDRYKSLLSSSPLLHSEEHLDILKIAEHSTFMSKNNEVKYNDTLKIYEQIYSCYKEDLGKDHKITKEMIRKISDKNSNLGDTCKGNKKYLDALSYYLGALIKYKYDYCTWENISGSGDAATYFLIHTRHVVPIGYLMSNIACTYNLLGDMKLSSNTEEGLQYYNEALELFKVVSEISKILENYDFTLNTLLNIAHTNNNLARALGQSKDLFSETIHHYQTALEIYGELKDKSWENAEEAGQRYESTEKWKNQLECSKGIVNCASTVALFFRNTKK